MARSHAKIACTVWADDDYATLSSNAQWLYTHLLAHPRLTLVGTIDLAERRWARLSKHADEAMVAAAITELEAAGYLLVDWDTEEVMIRTFTRHDLAPGRVNKNLAAGFWRAFDGILSARLRSAVAHAIPDDLWERLAPHAPAHAAQMRRSPRLEPGPPPRSEPQPDPRSEPEDEFRSQPTPTPPPPSDATPTLIPQTHPSSSSSQSEIATTAADGADEEDEQQPTADEPVDGASRLVRATRIATRIGVQAHERRLAAGAVDKPAGHRHACIEGALADHIAPLQKLIHTHPDWTDDQLIEHRLRPTIERQTVPAEESTRPYEVEQRRRDAAPPGDPPASHETAHDAARRAREALAAAIRNTTTDQEHPDTGDTAE